MLSVHWALLCPSQTHIDAWKYSRPMCYGKVRFLEMPAYWCKWETHVLPYFSCDLFPIYKNLNCFLWCQLKTTENFSFNFGDTIKSVITDRSINFNRCQNVPFNFYIFGERELWTELSVNSHVASINNANKLHSIIEHMPVI